MAETDPQPLGSNVQSLSEPKTNERLSTKMKAKSRKSSSILLADIKFERKNKPQPRLPPNHKIQKRPITHPSIAAPYAGPAVQKVVYVSQHTPIMAAVKRVRKLLEQVEKRKLRREADLKAGKRAGNIVAAPKNEMQTKQEVVLVKASGRAIEQAARIGEWFKRHAEDGDGGWVVHIRPLSVKVIDDIVEDSSTAAEKVQETPAPVNDGARQEESSPAFPAGDTVDQPEDDMENRAGSAHEESQADNVDEQTPHTTTMPAKQKRSKKKRKRPTYDADDVPEARTRFINAVEIAVSLK
jgi:ribonuclease P/MRP protein subunit POP7